MNDSNKDNENKTSLGAAGSILAALVGGGIFVLFLLVLQIGILISLAAGVAGYGAGVLIFSRRGRDQMWIAAQLSGLSAGDLQKTFDEGYWKLAQIRLCARKCRDNQISRKIEAIGNGVEKIFLHLKSDPRSIKAARPFLNYQLDAAIKIIKKYDELSSRQLQSVDIQQTLKKTESLLDSIEKAFSKQLIKLVENDVIDLETEVELLKRTLKMEGLED